MNQKRRFWTVLVVSAILLVASSNVWAESWNRAVRNRSSQPVTITVDAGHGNVWFTGACVSENGPCTIPPNGIANTKFTTTAGSCNGTFKFKHGTAPECTCRYFGGTISSAPSVRFSTSTCPSNIQCNIFTTTDQWWGYVEITD